MDGLMDIGLMCLSLDLHQFKYNTWDFADPWELIILITLSLMRYLLHQIAWIGFTQKKLFICLILISLTITPKALDTFLNQNLKDLAELSMVYHKISSYSRTLTNCIN